MSVSESLLPEVENEMASTRKMLERVPDEKWSWKPHAKSFSMGDLAGHIANLASWFEMVMTSDSFDVAPGGQRPPRREGPGSNQQLLAEFDANAAKAAASLKGADDALLARPWSLLWGGQPIFTMPKAAVLRSAVISHSIHHRGQLSLYLRLNDVPMPGMYGPSADEA
jgi:uncharacterized damage-inducible protein DinB